MHDFLQNQGDLDNPEFRIAWLRLARTKNVGAVTFIGLLKLFKTPQAALDNLPRLARNGGNKHGIRISSVQDIEDEIVRSNKLGAKIILACDVIYPPILRQIPDFPPVISARGRLDLLKRHKIGVVGARNASTNGIVIAKRLVYDLGKNGFVVVSGLARGIDAAAHSAALSSGTIGVIAGGIDNIYPEENTSLYRKLYEEGLVITEQALGAASAAQHFPQRNRIIAGLSCGIVVVEAAKRSGTLITARLALDYGRDVFAVPGSPLDVRCHGTNSLLRQGAILVESVEDILSHINRANDVQCDLFGEHGIDKDKQEFNSLDIESISQSDMNKYRQVLLSKLSFTPTSLDNILAGIRLPLEVVELILLEWELAGKIERSYGNLVCLVGSE